MKPTQTIPCPACSGTGEETAEGRRHGCTYCLAMGHIEVGGSETGCEDAALANGIAERQTDGASQADGEC